MLSKLVGKNLAAILCGLAFCASLLFAHVPEARAQQQEQDSTDAAPQEQEEDVRASRRRAARRRAADAAHLLTQLNLTPEQRAQLREIRRTSAPEILSLAQRLRRARRALDAAIYADRPDESVVAESAREVAEVQAAVVRLRAMTELRVRRVLTPTQLELFRQLRQQTRPRPRRNRMP